MKTLGFAIKLASQGAGNALECNKGSWTSKVVDIREYLKLFNGLQGTNNIVTFISFDENGCFLTQLRSISGRGGDFLSGWIYIPNNLNISGTDVMNAYNYVQGILLNESNLASVKDDIESFFSKEYEQKEISFPNIPSSGDKYGLRFLGHYSMKEILGPDRYQSYYSKYKTIFLIEKEGEISITKENANEFVDLTKLPIEGSCILKAPTTEDLRTLGKGVKIFFVDSETERVFDSPKLLKKEEEVKICAKRSGFERIAFTFLTTSEEVMDFPSLNNMQWRKKISASLFNVQNDNGTKISNAKISINGRDITSQTMSFTEDECLEADVEISAPDHEEWHGIVNLLRDLPAFQLVRKVKEQKYKIVLSNGHCADMTLESKDFSSSYSSHQSPIKVYTYDDEKRALNVSQWFVWKQRLWGYLGGLATICLIAGFFAFEAWIESHEFVFGWPPIKEKSTKEIVTQNNSETNEESTVDANKDSTTIAIAYLERNNIWLKDSLEQYAATRDLFDELNDFEFDKICERYELQLSRSNRLKLLVDVIKLSQGGGFDPKNGKITYDEPSSKDINVDDYRNWISTDHRLLKKDTKSEGPKTSGKIADNQQSDASKSNKKTKKKSAATNKQSQQQNKNTSRGEVQ